MMIGQSDQDCNFTRPGARADMLTRTPQEPIPGVRIYPHAMLMYASPAPGFEQLERMRIRPDPVTR